MCTLSIVVGNRKECFRLCLFVVCYQSKFLLLLLRPVQVICHVLDRPTFSGPVSVKFLWTSLFTVRGGGADCRLDTEGITGPAVEISCE